MKRYAESTKKELAMPRKISDTLEHTLLTMALNGTIIRGKTMEVEL